MACARSRSPTSGRPSLGEWATSCLEVFAAGGYDWAIYFYPCGKNPEDSKYLVGLHRADKRGLGCEGIVRAQAGGPEREREPPGSASPSASTNVMLHLVAAVDHHSLNRLRLLYESKLGKRITAEMVATIVTLADQHQFHRLKAIRLKFAANLAKTWEVSLLLNLEAFRHLESNGPLVLSELLLTACTLHEFADRLQRNGSSSMVGQRPEPKP
ncbi:hypothetical protein NL676_037098 [Syzygium grande]|nr:hypothetical protein NL676_037098 [Syzygium grande]